MRNDHLIRWSMLSLAGVQPLCRRRPRLISRRAAPAEAANKEAGVLKNQWTTTAQALAAAKQAAARANYDKAVELAKQAEALAKASIDQAKEQEEAWKAVIH